MKSRTQARELALKALYQYDLMGDRSGPDLREFCEERGGTRGVIDDAMMFVNGYTTHATEVDEVIRETAQNWDLERMAVTDRNILRLGVYELLFHEGTPPKVAINEAIELAKKYSTENSPTFVNGVLDKIYNTHVLQDHEEPQAEPPAQPGRPLSRHRFISRQVADPQGKADLHVHSTASDGSVEPEELPQLALRRSLAAFSLTDHDTVAGIEPAREAAHDVGVEVIPGVELTAYAEESADQVVELHIAGVFVDWTRELLLSKLSELREERVARIRRMAARLGEIGVEVDADAVLERASGGAVGRVHLAQEMAAQGQVEDIREAFDKYIGIGCPAYVKKERLTPAQAIQIITAAGGCSILCHPSFTDHIEERLEELVENGLDAVEVRYPGYSDEYQETLLQLARRHGLAVSGGSDFHGDAKPEIELGESYVSLVELAELQRIATARG